VTSENPSTSVGVSAASDVESTSDVLHVPESERVDWIEKVWRFFVSLRLMVVLMTLFSVAMAAGTFLNPKEDALAEIERAFVAKPWVITLYRAFELYAPFKSWWFTLIVLMLALNNLASSIERLPRIFLIVRNPQRQLTDAVLRGIRLRKKLGAGAVPAGAVESALRSAGYRTGRIDDGGTTFLFGERGSWTRFGVWGVHLALLVICFGAVFGRLQSFEGMIDLPENGGTSGFLRMREPDGTIIPRPLVDENGRAFAIRCEDFTLDRFADGSARRYSSELVVLDDKGKEIHRKRIIVNDPLQWAGMNFYQASYQERPDQSRAQMTITDTASGESKEVAASPEQPFFLGDGAVRFTVVNYDPSFGGLGPAVQVVREEGRGESAKSANFWVFANHPDFDRDFRSDRFALKFSKLEPSYITGIQVGYDPSIPWIYAGCVFLWISLFVTFWTTHRRVWARVGPEGVVLAGAAHRNKEMFAQEFERLIAALPTAPQPTA
jgi:cytochrome c biogenesis protein